MRFLFALVLLASCTQSKEEVARLLEKQGYTNVSTCGYSWLGCSKDDTYHTCFKAELNGKVIDGVICKGLFFKSSTIRFND